MKLKQDFVTNSSSMSFVVMGAWIDSSKISDEKIELLKSKLQYEITADDIIEYIDSLIEDTDLTYSFCGNWGSDLIAVGIEYTKMREDETLKDFKIRTAKQLYESFGNLMKPSHIQAGWEDR